MSLFARSSLAVTLLAITVGCTGEATPTAPTAPPEPAVTPAADPTAGDADALLFFHAQIDACNAWNVQVGNSEPGEKKFDGTASDPTVNARIVDRPAPGRYIVEDGEGSRLALDLTAHQIASPDGPGVALPIRYTFCPTEVFVGPAAD